MTEIHRSHGSDRARPLSWRPFAVLGAMALSMAAGAAIGGQRIPHTFAAGEIISAAAMNENFSALGADIDDLETAVTDLQATRIAAFRINSSGVVAKANFSPDPVMTYGAPSPYTITLPADLFADTPVCSVTYARTDDNNIFSWYLVVDSATTLSVGCNYLSADSELACPGTTLDFDIICVGTPGT